MHIKQKMITIVSILFLLIGGVTIRAEDTNNEDETTVQESLEHEEELMALQGFYNIEREEQFSVRLVDDSYVYVLIVDKVNNPSNLLKVPLLHIRSLETKSPIIELEMDLVDENREFVTYRVNLEASQMAEDFEASFSVNLNENDSRSDRNTVQAFENEKWILTTRVSGETGFVTYDDVQVNYSNGSIHGGVLANFTKVNINNILGMVTRDNGGVFDGNFIYGQTPTTAGKAFLSFSYDLRSDFNNQFVGMKFVVAYKTPVDKEVVSSVGYVYVGSDVTVNNTKTKIKPKDIHVEGQVLTGVQIPTIKEDLKVHIRPKGNGPWLELEPKNFEAVYSTGEKRYNVSLDADISTLLTPVFGSDYEVRFTIKTERTHPTHGYGSHTAVGSTVIRYSGWVSKEIYTFNKGVIGSQYQEYTPNVTPLIDPYYTLGSGTTIEQYRYYGWSPNQPESMESVNTGPVPNFSHVDETIYLVYQPVVNLVQIPGLLRFERAKEKDVILDSNLDLSMYDAEDLERGKESMLAITNLGPKDQGFDVYVSLSPFDNGKSTPSHKFTLTMNPDLVTVMSHGTSSQTIHDYVGNEKPVVYNIELPSNGQSMILLRSLAQDSSNKLAVWGLKFTEENTKLTRPSDAESGTYTSALHWEFRTGLNVTE